MLHIVFTGLDFFRQGKKFTKSKFTFLNTLTIEDTHLPKNCVICFNEIPLKVMKNAFYFTLALFLFSRYINFCLDFLVMQKKRLDSKVKVNFKIFDVINWLTNKCNTHIVQYLTRQRQPDSEMRSVNRIYQEKYFSSKIMEKMSQGDSLQASLFFGKALNEVKASGLHLVSIYFDSPQLGKQ